MKKVALALATVAAATVFAPEASAVPVFARQTGMACSACHYQHFPLLNGFGRAFKSGGYTMMGSQALVEGEALSLPSVVNLGVFTTAFVESQSGTGEPTSTIGTPGTGGEFSLFMGGRASDFLGFIAEAGLGGAGPTTVTSTGHNVVDPLLPAGTNGIAVNADHSHDVTIPGGGVVGATKMLMLFPVGEYRVGLSVHSSQGQGVAYSFETLNTGAANTHKMMGNSGPSGQHVRAAYAAQYLNTNTGATGASFIANNANGFVNVGLWEMAGNDVVGGANALTLNYVRAAYILDVAGLEVGVGAQRFGGESTVTLQKPDATVLDLQVQGDVAELPVGLYVTYGMAPKSTTNALGTLNTFNPGTTNDISTLNVAAEVGVIPHEVTVQAATRFATNGEGKSDNAMMLGATYELAQNIGLSIVYTAQSGDAWADVAGVTPVGKTATTFLLEALY